MAYPTLASMTQQTQEDSAASFDDLMDRNNRLFRTSAILGILAAAATAALLSFI